ncbi:S8 family serine peptidase, partial [Candidatus Poseidonia alphae]|nr:S8 family serine peptidase [Candidatus Poseidonia alphae]
MRRILAMVMLAVLMGPVTGSLVTIDTVKWTPVAEDGIMWMPDGYSEDVPIQELPVWVGDDTPWWARTTLDLNRNAIHDSLESYNGTTGIGLSYGVEVTSSHLFALTSLNLTVVDVIESVNAVLVGQVDSNLAFQLAEMDDVVMVERYGNVVLYGDIQTPAVKARNSTAYPVGAWDLGVTGADVNIAMVDTGVDNEHPGLNQKFIAGYDAVCYLHTDPSCTAGGARETDGTYDPDDGNQHGTACMGMAAASGIDASGTQTDFYGSAPDADLIDVRIGTDAGAGPFENYILEQEFYESAMNGIQWIIDNKDTAWQGADEE